MGIKIDLINMISNALHNCSGYYKRKSFRFSPEVPDACRSVLESAQYRSQGHRLRPSFVDSHLPQNASLVPLISEPIRVNVVSFVIHKRGNSQYPELISKMSVTARKISRATDQER